MLTAGIGMSVGVPVQWRVRTQKLIMDKASARPIDDMSYDSYPAAGPLHKHKHQPQYHDHK